MPIRSLSRIALVGFAVVSALVHIGCTKTSEVDPLTNAGGGGGGGGGTQLFTKQDGVSGATTSGIATAYDSAGNLYVAGNTTGALDAGVKVGSTDTFVSKYNSAGVRQWTKQMGGALGNAQARGMAVYSVTSSTAHIYVMGISDHAVNGTAITGSADAFLIQLDQTGTIGWTRTLGSAGAYTDGKAIAVDTSEEIYITGSTNGALQGGATGTTDMFVAQYSNSGVKNWVRQAGTAAATITGNAVTTIASTNVVVAGTTSGNFDGNTKSGTTDIFLIEYNSAGTHVQSALYSTSGAIAQGWSVASGAGGTELYLLGTTTSGLSGTAQVGFNDLAVFKIHSSNLVVAWEKQIGGPGSGPAAVNISPGKIAVDTSDNVYVGGSTTNPVTGATQVGTGDTILAKYNTSGTLQWGKQGGVASFYMTPAGMTTDSSGNVIVSGSTNTGLDGNTLSGTVDYFLGKYDTSTGNKL